MRRLIALIFACLLIVACNSGKKKNTEKVDPAKENARDGSNTENNKGNSDNDKSKGAYNWTTKEQTKFLGDCRRESEEQLAGDKLKDFCSCMLSQAQRYYPTYSQMDEKNNEEDDRKILENCGEYLDGNEKD